MIISEQRSGHDRRRHQRKNHFVANISHELRTPMQAMLAAIDLLRETQLTPQQARHVDVSKDACEYFLSLLNELLDYSQMENRDIQLSNESFHLPGLVESVMDLMRGQAKDKNIIFHCTVDPALHPWRHGDARRLKQILVNLVNNAIKFTEAGEISIAVTEIGTDRVLLEVTDTGIGIHESQHKQIFDSFVQAGETCDQSLRGVGLGLAICKQLVNSMAGDIYVRSQVGVGSTFSCELVLPVVDEPELQLHDGDVHTGQRDQFALSVLVVEDSPLNSRVMEDMLSQLECTAVCVSNGREAVKRFLSERYDLVLMDIRMPVMDGLRAVRSIRHLEKFLQAGVAPRHAMPIIALSASADPDEMKAALDAGCNDYLLKPLRKRELIQSLLKYAQDIQR